MAITLTPERVPMLADLRIGNDNDAHVIKVKVEGWNRPRQVLVSAQFTACQIMCCFCETCESRVKQITHRLNSEGLGHLVSVLGGWIFLPNGLPNHQGKNALETIGKVIGLKVEEVE